MAKELPYFRFTVAEWMNDDISLESYHMQGVFASVCAFYWFQDCSITKAKLKKRFNDAQEEIDELLNLGIIKENSDDFISIKFLDKQFDMLSEKRKKRVEAGRKGGLARSSNAKAKPKQSSSYKDKDKEKDNNKEKDKELIVSTNVHDVPNASDSVTWESALKVANYLLESICQYDTTHKYNHNEPSLDRWIKDIDRAIRLDGRTEDQLMYLINYIYRQNGKHSSFWAGNIESGAKLREQFDKIKNQIKSEKTNGRTHGNYNQKLAETEKFLDEYYSESN